MVRPSPTRVRPFWSTASRTMPLASLHRPIRFKTFTIHHVQPLEVEVVVGEAVEGYVLTVARLLAGLAPRHAAAEVQAAERPPSSRILPPPQVGVRRAVRWTPQRGTVAAPIPRRHPPSHAALPMITSNECIYIIGIGERLMDAVLGTRAMVLIMRARAGRMNGRGAEGDLISNTECFPVLRPSPKMLRLGPWCRRSRRVLPEGGVLAARPAAWAAIVALA